MGAAGATAGKELGFDTRHAKKIAPFAVSLIRMRGAIKKKSGLLKFLFEKIS